MKIFFIVLLFGLAVGCGGDDETEKKQPTDDFWSLSKSDRDLFFKCEGSMLKAHPGSPQNIPCSVDVDYCIMDLQMGYAVSRDRKDWLMQHGCPSAIVGP